MATQGERLEALEKENAELKAALAEMGATLMRNGERLSDVERILKDGETLDELRELVAKAAPLSDFEKLSETVAKHEAIFAEAAAAAMDAALIPADGVGRLSLEGAEVNPRDELLKAFRQIEAIANHINVRLPS